MSEFKKFGARAICFALVAIFCALVVSEDTEAEYTKSSIWSSDGYYNIDHDNDKDTSDQNVLSLQTDGQLRLKDISSDGNYIVAGTSQTYESMNYWQVRNPDDDKRGYYQVAAYYYNSSIPINVFEDCELGNDEYWNGRCYTRSVSISGDGERIAVSSDKYVNCSSSNNDGGPCDGIENTVRIYSASVAVYDTLTGNSVMEYEFCNSATDCSLYDSSFSEISEDGKTVIATYKNEIFYFDISANVPLQWTDFYNGEQVYQVRLSDDGSKVSVSAGEFIYYYEDDVNIWRTQLFGQVSEMDMSSDGSVIAAATSYMMIYSFETINAEPLWEYAHYQNIYGLDLSSTGSHIAISSNSGLLYFLAESNAPLWVTTDSYNRPDFISVSYNGMMVFASNYLVNSINGERIWLSSSSSSYYSCGLISDQGNFVVNGCSGVISFFTVNSQIFYPIAIAGEDTTKKTSQIVQFTGQGTDQDGAITKYEWDFDGNGVYDWYNYENGLYTYYYNNEGVYIATLRVTDNDGLTSTDTVTITISGVATGELIDPKDDGKDDDSASDDESNTGSSDEVPAPPEESTDDEDDEGLLPSLGIVTSIAVIAIIGWVRRYS